MSKKHCKRKHYALVNTIQHAIDGACITHDEALNKLRMRELAALEAFRTGSAGLNEWSDLTALLNIAETMAKSGIGPEALPYCQAAQDALIDAAKRFEKTQRMGLTGPGIQAIRELYEYHDLQRTSVARSEYERAIASATARARCKAPGTVDISEIA